MHLQRVEHALARNNDALGLLLHRQRPHKRSHLHMNMPPMLDRALEACGYSGIIVAKLSWHHEARGESIMQR
jgi:hypothetical protein